MADDYSTIAWRLERVEEALRDLGIRVVSVDLYTRDRAEIERDIAEIRAALAEEKLARREADKQIRDQVDKQADKQGNNWRQAIYAGVIPGVLFLATILLQLKAGSGK